MHRLTPYQEGQLLYLHFTGDFKYRTNKGRLTRHTAWIDMIDALTDNGYIIFSYNGVELTTKGTAYLDMYHMNIKELV